MLVKYFSELFKIELQHTWIENCQMNKQALEKEEVLETRSPIKDELWKNHMNMEMLCTCDSLIIRKLSTM